MSRPITPMSGAITSGVPAAGTTVPDSSNIGPTTYTGYDMPDTTHAQQSPEHLESEEIGRVADPSLQRPASQMSHSATYLPSRSGTLKKKSSLHKAGSVKRSGSRRSSYAGSVRSMRLGEKDKYEPAEYNSAFYCPVPTASNPTEILANRFQSWRKVLKDLINYFRDLHKSYEARSKTLLSASNVINNTTMPMDFMGSGGIGDAAEILRDFHKQALNEANKARDLENEVILQLTGLRSDLSQKIKEIKSLSGDFKNSVHKEQGETRKAVNAFQEALGLVDRDATAAAGKGDPFLMKLGVERQLERQIEEENYLHRAFLNLEASGRELESIVIGEIQKAYNVLAGILKRDADSNYDTAEKLREGPLAMARDHEWDAFVTDNTDMVDPKQPLRQVQNITYEGKDHPASIEVKSGMLERKSKYLKNYTPGWYILSPTHLHEFKSADQIPFQSPVMSLYLPEQKLGSHSDTGSSSHKFMLKGRQTGSMHRGHTWIFRAETHDTMMAWFSDIRELTERRGEDRNEFVRVTHARSVSASRNRAPSIGSGDSQMDEDEADKIAFAGEQSVRGLQPDPDHGGSVYAAGAVPGPGIVGDDARSEAGWRPPQRPQPGGRFPSEVNVTRGLQAPLSPSSGDSGDEHDRDTIAAANTLPGAAVPFTAAAMTGHTVTEPQPPVQTEQPSTASYGPNIGTGYTTGEHLRVAANTTGAEVNPETQSQYREWVGTAGAGLTGAAVGATGATIAHRHAKEHETPEHAEEEMRSSNPAIPTAGHSSVPIVAATNPTAVTTTSTVLDADDLAEPRGITASAYQETVAPVSAIAPMAAQHTPANGDLVGSTDIRAPVVAPGVQYSQIKPDPIASSAAVTDSATRPSPIHSKSIQTISDLHIPGEFPKPTTTSST